MNLTNYGKRTKSGDFEQVLQETNAPSFNWSEVENATLVGSGDEGRLYLSISSAGGLGIIISAIGDPRWVPGASRAVVDALRRGRPWWFVLRHPGVVGLSYLIIYIAGIAGLIRFIDYLPSSLPDILFTVAPIAFFAALAGLTYASYALLRRVFPAAEFVQVGAPSLRQKIRRGITTSAAALVIIVSVVQGLIAILGKK